LQNHFLANNQIGASSAVTLHASMTNTVHYAGFTKESADGARSNIGLAMDRGKVRLRPCCFLQRVGSFQTKLSRLTHFFTPAADAPGTTSPRGHRRSHGVLAPAAVFARRCDVLLVTSSP
jgi:hypothetical protein